MSTLEGRTILMSGGSRGIGLAIALRAARDGANVTLLAKTAEPHPRLEGTVHTAAAAIEEAGGHALAVVGDVREEASVDDAVAQTVERFGGIDIVVNNASAIQLTPVAQTDMRRFDLMHQINARGTFMVSKYALPYLEKAANPHILMLSPPLDMAEKWFAPHTGYSMAKFGMSLVVLGLAGEMCGKVAVNALWPRTTIATAAIEFNFPPAVLRASRHPAIMADAAHHILTRVSRECSGNFFIDEEVLREAGVQDLEHYAVTPGTPLFNDLFLG